MIDYSTLRITNAQDREISLVVEPWGEIFAMEGGATYEVRFGVAGEEAAELPEIVWTPTEIFLYAGVGGDLELYQDGVNLREAQYPRLAKSEINGVATAA